MYWNGFQFNDLSDLSCGPYESTLLKLNCDKALHLLNWHAVWSFKETIRLTAEWYLAYRNDPSSISDVSIAQIEAYTASALSQNVRWSL